MLFALRLLPLVCLAIGTLDNSSDSLATEASPLEVALKENRIACNPAPQAVRFRHCQVAFLKFPGLLVYESHDFTNSSTEHTANIYELPKQYSYESCLATIDFPPGPDPNIKDNSAWVAMEADAVAASVYCARYKWVSLPEGLTFFTGGSIMVGKARKIRLSFGLNPDYKESSAQQEDPNVENTVAQK